MFRDRNFWAELITQTTAALSIPTAVFLTVYAVVLIVVELA